MRFVSHLSLKYAIAHKDDMIVARILTYEPNPIEQLERADQVVLKNPMQNMSSKEIKTSTFSIDLV